MLLTEPYPAILISAGSDIRHRNQQTVDNTSDNTSDNNSSNTSDYTSDYTFDNTSALVWNIPKELG